MASEKVYLARCNLLILDTIYELAYSINPKAQTDVIFLDFSKALDKVSHDKRLHKIRYYGIGGKTNTWIRAFMCSRSQQVVVNGHTSQSAGVLSGVPQGSVLGTEVCWESHKEVCCF